LKERSDFRKLSKNSADKSAMTKANSGNERNQIIAKCGDCLPEIEEWSALGNRDIDGKSAR